MTSKETVPNASITTNSRHLGLQRLKRVDRYSRFLVFGFVREIFSKYKGTNQLWNNAPLLVHFIILKHCGPIVEFFTIAGNYINVLPRKRSIVKTRKGYESCSFGNVSVSSLDTAVYKWNIVVNRGNDVFLGLVACPYGQRSLKPGESLWDQAEMHRVYCYWSEGCVFQPDNDILDEWPNYGDNFGAGDTITIQLDLGQKTITFSRNNINQGDAYRNVKFGKDIEYTLAITLHHADSQVTIQSFRIC